MLALFVRRAARHCRPPPVAWRWGFREGLGLFLISSVAVALSTWTAQALPLHADVLEVTSITSNKCLRQTRLIDR